MHALLSAPDEEGRYKSIDQWCFPWKSAQWLLWALREYDPEFSLDARSVSATCISTRDLVRVASASPGEADVGYETVALYRKRYGIRMASAVVTEPVDASTSTQPEAPVDTSTQLEDAVVNMPTQPEVPIDTLASSDSSIDTPTQLEASVDTPTQPEPLTDSQVSVPTVYQQYVFDHRSQIGTDSQSFQYRESM